MSLAFASLSTSISSSAFTGKRLTCGNRLGLRKRARARTVVTVQAQLQNNDNNNAEGGSGDEASGRDAKDLDVDIFEAAAAERSGGLAQDRLNQIASLIPPTPREDSETAAAVLECRSGLDYVWSVLPGIAYARAERYLSNPVQLLLASALSILFGFFGSTAASTIIGSVADWDPLAALVLLLITESFTKWYYSSDLRRRSRTIQLVNAFKIGLIFGMTVDAFKLST